MADEHVITSNIKEKLSNEIINMLFYQYLYINEVGTWFRLVEVEKQNKKHQRIVVLNLNNEILEQIDFEMEVPILINVRILKEDSKLIMLED